MIPERRFVRSLAASWALHVGLALVVSGWLLGGVERPSLMILELVGPPESGPGRSTALRLLPPSPSPPTGARAIDLPGKIDILPPEGGASAAPVTPRIEGRLKSPARQGNDEPVEASTEMPKSAEVPADLIAPASRASDILGSAKVAVVPSGGQQRGRTGSTSANPIDTTEVAKEFGAGTEGSSILGSGDAVRRPQYLTNPPPEYPEVARRRGYEGVVLLKVRILPDGTIGDIQVERSSGHKLLDEAAINTVKRWTFIPAQRNGIPIPIWATIPIRFSLFSS